MPLPPKTGWPNVEESQPRIKFILDPAMFGSLLRAFHSKSNFKMMVTKICNKMVRCHKVQISGIQLEVLHIGNCSVQIKKDI